MSSHLLIILTLAFSKSPPYISNPLLFLFISFIFLLVSNCAFGKELFFLWLEIFTQYLEATSESQMYFIKPHFKDNRK